jgi:hypothetical protein
MAKKKISSRGSRQETGSRMHAAAPAPEESAPGNAIPAGTMKKTIAFFYLLSFCPPEKLGGFIRTTASLRGRLAAEAGMESGAYFSRAAPEVCRRIVAFHQAAREPDAKTVAELSNLLRLADRNPENLSAYQTRMAEIASLPARAGMPNRVLQDRGCRRCASPCRFGFFILISNPQFGRLQGLLAEETAKPASGQSPLAPALGFAVSHTLDLTGAEEGYLRIEDLANLSYCLLVWGMARSRLAPPAAGCNPPRFRGPSARSRSISSRRIRSRAVRNSGNRNSRPLRKGIPEVLRR